MISPVKMNPNLVGFLKNVAFSHFSMVMMTDELTIIIDLFNLLDLNWHIQLVITATKSLAFLITMIMSSEKSHDFSGSLWEPGTYPSFTSVTSQPLQFV